MSGQVVGVRLPALVALAAFTVRFLRLGTIENDHYVYLARAHQVLRGDWPVRDFSDPGMPLGYMLSAGAAWIAGPTLLTEATLSVALFALAVATTFVLARRASGSVVIGLAAAVSVVILPPRLYNSSKVLVPLLAVLLAWRYADQPTTARIVALGAWTGIAFLFRHDYAVYLSAATLVLLVVQHHRQRTPIARPLIAYSASALVVLLPWLLYVAQVSDLTTYFADGISFSAAEGARTRGSWPALFYVVVAVPLVAGAAALRTSRTIGTAHTLFAATLLLLADLVFLRDDPAARIPDVLPVSVVVVSILTGYRRWGSGLQAAAIGIAALLTVGGVAWRWDSVHVQELAFRPRLVAERLRGAEPAVIPNPALASLIRYLERCTRPDERLLVSGFGPEIPVLAGRAFAGGQPAWIPGYFEDVESVARARARLAREDVAAAIMLNGGGAFSAAWPAVAADLSASALQPMTFVTPGGPIEVWLRASAALDGETGLPCPASPPN